MIAGNETAAFVGRAEEASRIFRRESEPSKHWTLDCDDVYKIIWFGRG